MDPITIPPPAYTLVSRTNEIALTRTMSSTLSTSNIRRSVSKASSTLHPMSWTTHPGIWRSFGEWKRRWIRMGWKREVEIVSDTWPDLFVKACRNAQVSPQRIQRGQRRYLAVVSELNEVLPTYLVKSRLILVILELINLIEFFFLLTGASLSRTSTPGPRLIDAAAITLIVVFLVNAAGINAVRTNRWRLSLRLKRLAGDRNPVPVEPDANGFILGMRAENHALGLTPSPNERDVESNQNELENETVERDRGDLLFRWSFVGRRGTWWTSYRRTPFLLCASSSVVLLMSIRKAQLRVELIIPPQSELNQVDEIDEDYGVPPTTEARPSNNDSDATLTDQSATVLAPGYENHSHS